MIDLPFALRLARIGFLRSTEKIRVGAALVDKGLLIIGSNQRKSSPALIRYKYRFIDSMHAETSLFARLTKVGKNAIVGVYRETAAGELALARPCEGCMRLLREHGVRATIFTTANGYTMENINV